jgi:hypothetical protein
MAVSTQRTKPPTRFSIPFYRLPDSPEKAAFFNSTNIPQIITRTSNPRQSATSTALPAASMVSFDTITRLIVGRGAAERSEYRRLERLYKDAEAKNKMVTEVVKPSTPSQRTREYLCLPNCAPISLTINAELQNRSGTCPAAVKECGLRTNTEVAEAPALSRTHSTPTVARIPTSPSRENLKRTNSEQTIATLPLPEMVGFGRYRHALDASPAWQLQQLEQNLSNDGDLVAAFLGDQPPSGIDPQVWQQYRQRRMERLSNWRTACVKTNLDKAPSWSRSTSSSNGPSPTVLDASSEYTDPATGTKVVRGFSGSPISVASSPKKSVREVRGAITSTLATSKNKENSLAAFRARHSAKDNEGEMSGCAVLSDEDEGAWEDME